MPTYSGPDISAPTGSFVAITKSDSATFTATRGLHIGTGGDIYVDGKDLGTNVPLKNLQSGMYYPYEVTRIYSTGTTAADIVGLY